jgi:hypothetical protein
MSVRDKWNFSATETTNLSMIFHALELFSHLAQSVNQQAYSGILLPACRFTELAYEYRIPACIEIETARCWSWYVRGVQWRRLVWLWLLTSMNQAGTASTASQLAQFCVAIHQHSGYSVSGWWDDPLFRKRGLVFPSRPIIIIISCCLFRHRADSGHSTPQRCRGSRSSSDVHTSIWVGVTDRISFLQWPVE